ncbi:MAG: hypothetical protein JSU05_10815, partial [Bacteroidetes bacterium]|nr:hypothetical protein [Bacteroidota bacterium]
MKKKSKWLVFIIILLFIFIVVIKLFADYWLGESQYQHFSLVRGNITVPHQRTIMWNTHSAFADSIYHLWAGRTIPENNPNGKTDVARILLAKLLVQQDFSGVNSAILKLKVWGRTGSSWALNKKGDYDFNL